MISTITDYLINKTLTSGFLKSRILAWTRAGALTLGTYLVTHGIANQEIANSIAGFLLTIVTLYLQDLDVKVVDGKIKIALHTPAPGQSALVVEEKTMTVTSTGGQPETLDPTSDNDITGASVKTTTVEVKTLPEIK